MIYGHYIWIYSSGIAFKCCNFLAPYLLRDFNVLDCHWPVLDLVAANHPLVVLSWRIYEYGLDSPSNLRTLVLSHSETFFVLRGGVNNSELLIYRAEVMYTTFMNSELHIWFTFRLFMNNEHHLVVLLCNEVLETQVYQRYNIGDESFAEPHTVVIAIHCLLVGHCHCTEISLNFHFRF